MAELDKKEHMCPAVVSQILIGGVIWSWICYPQSDTGNKQLSGKSGGSRTQTKCACAGRGKEENNLDRLKELCDDTRK